MHQLQLPPQGLVGGESAARGVRVFAELLCDGLQGLEVAQAAVYAPLALDAVGVARLEHAIDRVEVALVALSQIPGLVWRIVMDVAVSEEALGPCFSCGLDALEPVGGIIRGQRRLCAVELVLLAQPGGDLFVDAVPVDVAGQVPTLDDGLLLLSSQMTEQAANHDDSRLR